MIYVLMASALALCGCTESAEPSPGEPSPLVVEGWIEDGGKPVVIVTRAADLSKPTGPVEDLVQRWCRVTVSDGEESEVLAMHIDKDYFPPVVYTSARMKGNVGRSYTLKVETDADMVTAVTTIPPVVRIDSLSIRRVQGADGAYNVRVFAAVDGDKSPYYKVFTRVNGESRYYSSFLGLFRAEEYDKGNGWNAARGMHDTFGGHFSPNYLSGDTVRVKLCTLDSEAYKFWDSYEAAVSLQSNFVFLSTDGCKGNIVGGKGYWAGYGTSYARCVLE